MSNITKPICDKCGVRMLAVSSRLGKGPSDTRSPSRRPYRRVGFICMTCKRMEVDFPKLV